RWLVPGWLLLGGTPLEEDGEGTDEVSCLLALSGWAPGAAEPPQGAVLYTDAPGFVEEECTARLSGPYLHALAVPQWGALVRCHRKAADDHVRLLRLPTGDFGSGTGPQAVAITEDKLGIRLPNGPDEGSNFVLGLGFDTSLPLEPLPHPLNPEQPPLTPPPVVLVVTSDGALRVYGFGHLDLAAQLRPGADAVRQAELPEWAAAAAGGGGDGKPLVDETDKAAKAALPDDEDIEDSAESEMRRAAAAAGVASDSESGEEVTSPGITFGAQSLGAAAATQSAAGPSGPTFPGTGGMFGSSGAAFKPASAAPAFGAAPPATSAASAPFGLSGPAPAAPSTSASSSGFGFGFGVAPAAPAATSSAPAAPAGGLFAAASTAAAGGGGLFGSTSGSSGSLFAAPASAPAIIPFGASSLGSSAASAAPATAPAT
ncbi:hypothetical protein Agub_g8876, partial [Astrephomene gubernaculifera]